MAVAAFSVEDMKSLAQHIHGQPKSMARLVDEFHEKYSQYLKRNIEAQIKQMTKYEKRGADTRLKYYLSKEIQAKYGIKVWLKFIYISRSIYRGGANANDVRRAFTHRRQCHHLRIGSTR